jgi:hypothetical protein
MKKNIKDIVNDFVMSKYSITNNDLEDFLDDVECDDGLLEKCKDCKFRAIIDYLITNYQVSQDLQNEYIDDANECYATLEILYDNGGVEELDSYLNDKVSK